MSTLARVDLWGVTVGAVLLPDGQTTAIFEYDPEFAERAPVEVSPLLMPRSREPYRFPGLAYETFRGLPGLLADSLPDRYGDALINTWLATQGRTPDSFNAVERLCYIGRRGMGALQFSPAAGPAVDRSKEIAIDALVELASEVLTHREQLVASLDEGGMTDTMRDILSVGTSAGGARAKAVIAWNPSTNAVRSGQVEVPAGFEHWLLKFDGVSGNRDKDVLADPEGYGAIEYAYYEMARAAGIEMTECRLLEEGGRRHFMTRRFDRTASGGKIHMQSLGALAHLDFNQPGAHSYEEALLVVRRLGLPAASVEQLVRRMVFNVVARNQDDHVKNIAFLMDRDGAWRLAPAFDMTYAYRPDSPWTGSHQMTINGKRDRFEIADLERCAESALVTHAHARAIVDEVSMIVRDWPRYAEAAGVDEERTRQIAVTHRLELGQPHRRAA